MAHVFQSICQLKLLFWEVCLDFCQSDEFMDIPYFFNYLDIAEGFPIVRWEKFFGNLHPRYQIATKLCSPLKYALTINYISFYWQNLKGKFHELPNICTAAFLFFFEGSCLVNQIIDHRHLLCTLYIYWPLFLDKCSPDKTAFFWPCFKTSCDNSACFLQC